MIKSQLIARGIRNKDVLKAMKEVPRHLFVPADVRALAYDDRPLPIGHGQTISQPYIVALMTELLNLNKESTVLEIGTGSGYQAAVLAKIIKKVYTIEIVSPLYKRAVKTFKTLNLNNIEVLEGDGYYGWEDYAPYDGIIVTCASESVPPPLLQQLKTGGLICIPLGPVFGIQNLVLIKKKGLNEVISQIITGVRFVPLTRYNEEE